MFRNALIVSSLSILYSLVSFACQLLIAQLFGATVNLDVYLLAVSVPTMIIGLVAGLFSYSLVPAMVRHKVADAVGYPLFSGMLFMFFSCLALIIPLLAYFLVPGLIRLFVPTLSGQLFDEAAFMARISWVAAGSALIINYLTAVHNSAQKFLAPGFSSLFPSLGMIAAMVLGASYLGVSALAWGMLGGYLFAIPLLYKGVSEEMTVKAACLKLWREGIPIFRSMPAVLISMLGFAACGAIDAFWASRLGPGNLSYIGYAQRMLVALGSVAVAGPGTVLTPFLSEQAAAGRQEEFLGTIGRSVRMAIVFAAPIAVTMSLLRVPVIELMFQRGAFDAAATRGVSSVLPGMLCGMVGMICVVLLLRALHAKGDFRGAAILGGSGAIMYFCFSGILSRFMGISGIVLAYATTWWLLMFFSAWRVWGVKARRIINPENLKFAGYMLAALSVSGVSVLYLKQLLIRPVVEVGLFELALRFGIISGIGGFGFLGMALWVFRMPEVTKLVQRWSFKSPTDREVA